MSDAAIAIDLDDTNGKSSVSSWDMPLRYLFAAWTLIIAIFWRDAWAMVSIWWNVSTYGHCLLIPPIIYWLIWQRRDDLKQIEPTGWRPGLGIVGVAAFGWLLGEAAGVAFARQLGLIMMLQGAVVTILGPNVTRALLFPLFYALFMIPFGEEFVPQLQTITASICMTLLGWAGIPAYIDGVFISTPTGYFEVAEACSGVKFLIAMIAYGALVANVCFKSWTRRIIFMMAAIIVPILANGIRAWGTIYIAHHSSIDFAVGFDHVFYGWIFFAIVLALVMAIGWPFFDRKLDARWFDPASLQQHVRQRLSLKMALGAILTLCFAPMIWSGIVAAQTSPVPAQIVLPNVEGWQRAEYNPVYPWTPRHDGANHRLLGRYRNGSGAMVDLSIAVFDRQGDGREVVGYGQGAVDPDSEWAWAADGDPIKNGTAMRIAAPGPVVREVVAYYRVGETLSGSDTSVKLATLKARLFGGNQQAVAVMISSERIGDIEPRRAIDQFIQDLGPIDRLADQMAGIKRTSIR